MKRLKKKRTRKNMGFQVFEKTVCKNKKERKQKLKKLNGRVGKWNWTRYQ